MSYISSEVQTGTTIMALKTSTGVIIGADCRTSSGIYIPSRLTDKLTKLTNRIFCCRSGSAADTQRIADIVRNRIEAIEIAEEKEITVKRVARLISTIVSNNRHLVAGIIIAGYDSEEGGSVYTIKLGGALIKEDIAIGGSGSLFLYGHIRATYRESMSDMEKFGLVRKSIALAIKSDGASGGGIRMAVIGDSETQRYFYADKELDDFIAE